MVNIFSKLEFSLLWKLVLFHVAVITVSNALVAIPVEMFGFKLTWAAFTFPLVVLATDLTVSHLREGLLQLRILWQSLQVFL